MYKILISIIFLLVTCGVIVMFKEHSLHFIWGIPFYLILIWVIFNIWQHEIIIDDKQIIQKFSKYTKPKVMTWDNIDLIVKDGLDDLMICRLVTRSPIKPRKIIISGIKDMELLIIEIVKRARYASVDPVFKEMVEKNNCRLRKIHRD